MKATFKQAIHLLQMVDDKRIEPQALIDSGLLAAVLDLEDPYSVDLDEFKKLMKKPPRNLKPFSVPVNFELYRRSQLSDLMEWDFFQHDLSNAPAGPSVLGGVYSMMCVPACHMSLNDAVDQYVKEHRFPAGFRETVLTAISTPRFGYFVCPIPTKSWQDAQNVPLKVFGVAKLKGRNALFSDSVRMDLKFPVDGETIIVMGDVVRSMQSRDVFWVFS